VTAFTERAQDKSDESNQSDQAGLPFGGRIIRLVSCCGHYGGVVVLEGVRKRYSRGGPWVLDGVDLTVHGGVVTVIVAGNGTGKSTLLRIIAGASLPSSGKITGRPAAVGYIPERAPTALRMSTRQYMAHIGRMHGMSSHDVRVRTDELAERLSLAPGPTVPISSLSKGNGQKVAVIQAFLTPPELLVVDEPDTGLDGPASEQLAGLLFEAERDGAAIVLSAHERVVPVDGQMYRLVDGKLVADSGRGMRIVLRAARSGLSIKQFEGLAEVMSEEPGRVILRTDDADRLLVQALAGGWSLVEAKP
jgi:ABC-2 type transport system ATP-binding protein